MAEKDLWFVLYCNKDDSHSLVSKTDVIYGESGVHVGDKVKFVYGNKKIYDGVVKALGENHSELQTIQDKLNKQDKPKRDSSFHSDRRRRAAVNCFEKGFTGNPSQNHTRSDHKSKKNKKDTGSKSNVVIKQLPQMPSDEPPTKRHKHKKDKKSEKKEEKSIFGKCLETEEIYSDSSCDSRSGDVRKPCMSKSKTDECSKVQDFTQILLESGTVDDQGKLTDTNDSHSENSEELTEEEVQALLKIQKKKKNLDIKALLSLSCSKENNNTIIKANTSGASRKERAKECIIDKDEFLLEPDQKKDNFAPRSTPSSSGLPSKAAGPTNSDVDTAVRPPSPASDEPSTSSDSEDGGLLKAPEGKGMKMKRYKNQSYEIKKFEGEFFQSKADTPTAMRLHADHNVFILKSQLKWVKKHCNTPSALSRALVKAVFTAEARKECSVSGRPSAGKGADAMVVRPALHKSGVNAIIDYVQARSEKKSWKALTDAGIKQAMGNVLCEDRDHLILAAAEENTKDTQ